MGDLKTYQTEQNKCITTPFGEFTRTDGSKYIVTPMYLPLPRLSRSFTTPVNYSVLQAVYSTDINPLYGEIPINFGHSASARSYGQNQSVTIKMGTLKKQGFVPYSICVYIAQNSNQGSIQTYVDIGSTRYINESYHSDHGKNNPVTRMMIYKWSIFYDYYNAPYGEGVGKRGNGCPPWLVDYISNPEDLRDIVITTGAHWGDRGGWDNINVLVYFGLVSELVDNNGIYYHQPTFY